MLHFPSQLQAKVGVPRRTDSLNATQHKASSHQIFLTIEDELHDARRVHAHGQEEDLRQALSMVIERVGELSTLLKDAYRTTAELETQLGVARSNLQLVISNNEMLEEALKRDSSGSAKDVGWRRSSAREGDIRVRASDERPRSADFHPIDTLSPAPLGSPRPATATSPAPQDSRFFRFRFTGAAPAARPTTANGVHHLTSPSLPTLPQIADREREELIAALEREREAHKAACRDKEALEAELESLSQALFEEANKMVATERIRRAETEEELKEARLEKEALRSALRLVEGEYSHLRTANTATPPPTHSRSSSRDGIKSPSRSRAQSGASLQQEPEMEAGSAEEAKTDDARPAPAETPSTAAGVEDIAPPERSASPSLPTATTLSPPQPTFPTPTATDSRLLDEPSPWADVPSAIRHHNLPSIA